MSKYPSSFYISDNEAFGYWVFQNPDIIEELKRFLPKNVSDKLDYSVESLDILEEWMLDNFATVEDVTSIASVGIIDGIARYVGRVFIGKLNGKWEIELENSDNIYYNLPIVKSSVGETCPLSIVSTAIDRRLGHFMSGVLKAKMKRLA